MGDWIDSFRYATITNKLIPAPYISEMNRLHNQMIDSHVMGKFPSYRVDKVGFYKHKFGGIFLVRRFLDDLIEIDNGTKILLVKQSFLKDLTFMSEPLETMCEECGSVIKGYHGECCPVCGARAVLPLIERNH